MDPAHSPTQPGLEQTDLQADLLTDSYDYDLPESLIAQAPVSPRDQARMLVVQGSHHLHRRFSDLPDWLEAGDLLVVNDTKVIPARLMAHKATGAKIEVLLLEQQTADTWLVLVKPGRRVHLGDRLQFGSHLQATVTGLHPETGGRILEFTWPPEQSFASLLEQIGEIPFPPYITERTASPDQYQTVWASQPGSVAAPTAGLHFTPQLLDRLQAKGIRKASITLNIGLGTFRPVEAAQIRNHQLHSEWLQVPEETVAQILATQQQGGRVIAVGTTTVRSLETAAQSGRIQPWQGKSDLFIYPGYRWRVVQGLITNFHLPRSSLLMLVSALIGRERLLRLYEEAKQEGYRFYSFGDGMVILPGSAGLGRD